MKKIIITISLVLIAFLSAHSQKNATRFRVHEVYPEVCDELNLNVEIMVLYVPKKFSSDITGYTVRNIDGSYGIYLKKALSQDEAIEWFIHEMIHVHQFESKIMEVVDGQRLWNGKVLRGGRVKEFKMPHEVHARKYSELICNNMRLK
jgi:hypothetical protein